MMILFNSLWAELFWRSIKTCLFFRIDIMPADEQELLEASVSPGMV